MIKHSSTVILLALYFVMMAAKDVTAPTVTYYQDGEEICIDGQCEAEQE